MRIFAIGPCVDFLKTCDGCGRDADQLAEALGGEIAALDQVIDVALGALPALRE
jgi:hypothetical protein